jgi:hypothetical protein
MERDYKFRGKRVDNGEWVYGYYVCYGGAIPNPTHHIIHAKNNLNRFVGENFEVDPATVGEYTGLHDRKRTAEYPEGQPIYEGDICLHISKNHRPIYFEIKWDSGYAMFILTAHKPFYHSLRFGDDLAGRDVEIVGDIFSNPELLQEVTK